MVSEVTYRYKLDGLLNYQLSRDILNRIMATHNSILPLALLHIDALTVVNSWHQWKSTWIEYEVATDLDEKTQQKRMSTLLSVISQDAKDIWQNYPWTDVEDRYKVEPVLQMYEEFCISECTV